MQLLPYAENPSHGESRPRSCSGASTPSRPIAEGLQRFDLAEYLRRPDAVKPNAACIGTISNGKISAQIRYTETSTCFGGRRPWMLCPRCSRRCRVLFLGFGRVACRRCFRLRYQSQCPRPDRSRLPSTQWARLPNKSIQRRRARICRSAGQAAGHALEQVQSPRRTV